MRICDQKHQALNNATHSVVGLVCVFISTTCILKVWPSVTEEAMTLCAFIVPLSIQETIQ